MRRLMALADLGPTVRFAYHYTKAATALERILPSMTLRLGPITDTNDPAECPTPATAVGSRDGPVETMFERTSAVADEKLVKAFQVALASRGKCLSRDVEYSDKVPRLPAVDLRKATLDPARVR